MVTLCHITLHLSWISIFQLSIYYNQDFSLQLCHKHEWNRHWPFIYVFLLCLLPFLFLPSLSFCPLSSLCFFKNCLRMAYKEVQRKCEIYKKNAVVQSLSHVWLFATPWTIARQASLSFTISWSLLKLTSIELVVPPNHLVLCHPLLLLPSVFPSIRVFPNESALCIRWPKYWSFSFSISPSNERTNSMSPGER